MTKKQKITGAVAAITATAAITGSLFVGNRYEVEKNAITTDLADNMQTVLIIKTDEPNKGRIVYANQVDETFSASETFYMLDDIESGKYTMMMNNSDGELQEKTFWVTADGLGLNKITAKD